MYRTTPFPANQFLTGIRNTFGFDETPIGCTTNQQSCRLDELMRQGETLFAFPASCCNFLYLRILWPANAMYS